MIEYSHEPAGYRCPFCLFIAGREHETWNRADDLVHQDRELTALISPEQWPRNPGHVLVIPNAHYENLYDLPVSLGASMHVLQRSLALAMKRATGCAGTSTRQHNEPAGNQEVFHYHAHVFPRFERDDLYRSAKHRVDEPTRRAQASQLREALAQQADHDAGGE